MTNPARPAPKSRRFLLLLLAACAAALLYALFHFASNSGAKKDGADLKRFAQGQLAGLEFLRDPPEQPDIKFTDSAGKQVSLADFRGKVALVNLWATWCPPCRAEMPTLAGLASTVDPDKVVIAAISMDSAEKSAEAKAFIESLGEHKLSFYQDDTSKLAFALQAPGLPVTIIYDAAGKEVARLAGAADWASPEAKALLAAIGQSGAQKP
ncbi:MAG: TlpA disulfide reductase family protein [Caulobacterales bacterium]